MGTPPPRPLGALILAAAFAIFAFVLLVTPVADSHPQEERIKLETVRGWANKMGGELWHFGEYITRRKEVQDSFKTAQVETRDGRKLVEEMAADICNMMALKVSAVKRIMDTAENMAVMQQNDPMPEPFVYYNSKQIADPSMANASQVTSDEESDELPNRDVVLIPNPHFNNMAVNTSFSSVHVPTNVYDWSPNVIQAIKWSENLNSIFTSNYKADPSLSWQYFGSSTGFMRHYPAKRWVTKPVDLFDCRTRAWYIEAASSPKDVIILVDISGSMTGQRKDIAFHVVSNILDTLGNNDFVNIFKFNDTVMEVVPCFEDKLVQATLGNVRELKLGMDTIETSGIANFSAALVKAFEILKTYREESLGAHCNQAIMLVTDGVPYNYKEIFETYNWEDKKNMSARVFTYLIGREVPDVREVQWMACANMGYYVHLSTLAEVREQVLQYVPVMARPLVLWGDIHPIIWTPVYADVTDPKMMDYLWEEKECKEQEERIMSYRKNYSLFMSKEEQDRRFVYKQKQKEDQHDGLQQYRLMTSVSMPVFDRTENATRVANLLGVAGTDVPIQDIQALMMPHQLGVNGYAFIVTNNGYILVHPDLRPVFQGILKPNYNSVDMVEVELMDDERGPRDFPPELIQFRSDVIDQKNSSLWLQVKYHYDSMKRVSRIRRQYFWTGIPKSPFTLVVALTEPYGLHRLSLRPEDDIHRNHVKGDDVTNYFTGKRWRIHPEWLYCRHHQQTFASPEAQLLYFLKRMVTRWVWPLKPTPPEEMHSNMSSGKSEPKTDYFCDRSLMQAVVFDARVTNWFSQNITNTKEEKAKDIIQKFGITVTFVATHSGLTRWKSFSRTSDNKNEKPEIPEFGEIYPRAIDEIWYRRAVEQHYMEPQSFVFSVPFDAGDQISQGGPTPLVTATHAVFHTVDKQSAPAAVVGFQFNHTRFHAYFTNMTSTCGETVTCQKTCKSDDLDCYVVDNNGFIIVSEDVKETGKFFGEVSPYIMKMLVLENIYRQVQLTDYQAVCFVETDTTSPANSLLNPFRYLRNLLNHLLTYLLWIWHQTFLIGTDAYGYPYTSDEEFVSPTVNYDSETEIINEGGEISKIPPTKAKEREFDKLVLINRTRPTPCDQEVRLYQLQQYLDKEHTPYKNSARGCERPFVVQEIPGSNLILVVIDALCQQMDTFPLKLTATQIPYNESLPCVRASMQPLSRRRLEHCIRHHPNESEINLCGRGAELSRFPLLYSLLLSLSAAMLIH